MRLDSPFVGIDRDLVPAAPSLPRRLVVLTSCFRYRFPTLLEALKKDSWKSCVKRVWFRRETTWRRARAWRFSEDCVDRFYKDAPRGVWRIDRLIQMGAISKDKTEAGKSNTGEGTLDFCILEIL